MSPAGHADSKAGSRPALPNSVQETYDYNNRLQPARIMLGSNVSGHSADDYCLAYNYYSGLPNPTGCTGTPGAATSGNNGNVMGYYYQDSKYASLGHTATYTYDSLNRLLTAVATGSSTYNLTFNYTGDGSTGRWGNMTCQTNGQTQGLCTTVSFDPATNRMYANPQGRWLTPDPAGKGAVHLGDPQTWNMYAYVRNNPTTLTDPTGLTIDSSECDANKQCAKWKKNYLKHEEAQKQWKALDENKNLLVKLKWDPKSGQSVTGNYKWNDAGILTDVIATLAGKTGSVTNRLTPATDYPYGSKITGDPLRQAYVIAHEFGHVEQADEPGIHVLYEWMARQSAELHETEKRLGPKAYSNLSWAGQVEDTLQQVHSTLERGADARAHEVIGDEDQQ